MPELIYARDGDTYYYVYNPKNKKIDGLKSKFPENDAVIYRMVYDEIQICKIGRHRKTIRPSSYYEYYYEKVGREFFRDSFSSVFDLQFVDERDFDILANGGNISKCREQGEIDSLESIGDFLVFTGKLRREVLEEILHAVIFMLKTPDVGYVGIGIPFEPFNPKMNYEAYTQYCKSFGRMWRMVLRSVYAYLPYMLRRQVGFTVNAQGSYSDKEIRVFPIDKLKINDVCVLNPPKNRDPECMKLVNYLVKARDEKDLVERLDILKSAVENYISDGAINSVLSANYIRYIGEIDEFESMNDYSLMEMLYGGCVELSNGNGDEAAITRLSQYIRKFMKLDCADRFVKKILCDDFVKVIQYIEFLMDVIHRPFPEYRIPYGIILSAIDRYAIENVFIPKYTPHEIKTAFDGLLEMIDKDASEDDCLPIYECAVRMLKSRLEKMLKSKNEELLSTALEEMGDNSVPWKNYKKWLLSYDGDGALSEIKEMKSRKLMTELADMTLSPSEALNILSQHENAIDNDVFSRLTELLRFLETKSKNLISYLMSIDGRTEEMGLEMRAPSEYMVRILTKRYKTSDLLFCFNQPYNNDSVDDLFNLEITSDYNVKRLYRQTLISILKNAGEIQLQINRKDFDRYCLFIQNLCTADETINDIKAQIQLEVGKGYEMFSFETLEKAFYVFYFVREKRSNTIDRKTLTFLMDEKNSALINYMIENGLLFNCHLEAMSNEGSIRKSKNLLVAFTVLASNEYLETINYKTLTEFVKKEKITSADLSSWFPKKGHYTPIETLALAVKAQDEKTESKKTESESSAGCKGTSKSKADELIENSSNDENKSDAHQSASSFDILLFAISAIMLIFAVVGIVFAYNFKETMWLFCSLTIISSVFAGGSIALLLDKFFRNDDEMKSSEPSKRFLSSNWFSIGCGAIVALIVCIVIIMLGTGKSKQLPSNNENNKSATVFLNQISQGTKPLKTGYYNIISPDGRYIVTKKNSSGTEYLTLGNTPQNFYIMISENKKTYCIYTDNSCKRAVGLYRTSPDVFNFSVDEFDSSFGSMQFYLNYESENAYRIFCAYNDQEIVSLNKNGEIVNVPADDISKVVLWKILPASIQEEKNNQDKSEQEKVSVYQPDNPDHYYVRKCTISTIWNGTVLYLTCGMNSNAVLTENETEAILYEERDTSGNLYFVAIDNSGKHLSLCYKGNRPKDKAVLLFKAPKTDETYQWRNDGSGFIRSVDDENFAIYAVQPDKVILKKLDEDCFGTWQVFGKGK